VTILVDRHEHPSLDLIGQIVSIASQPNVHSVSCPFQDYDLWRALVAEQVQRSRAMQVEPQVAFRLNGPDGGVPNVHTRGGECRIDREWGGEIHIPYEGVAGGDLFIQPKWFGFVPALARRAPTLAQAVFGNHALDGYKTCNYLITHWRTLGELECADRTEIGDWVLYADKTMRLDAAVTGRS